MATKASQKAPENRLSENIGSIILGFVVVLILGGFLLNVFRGNKGEVGDSGTTEEEQAQEAANKTTYTVQPGDTLWIIAERETGSGYNWQEIADANNLASADDIEEGMTLTIPSVSGDTTVTGVPEPTTTDKQELSGDKIAAEITLEQQEPTVTPVVTVTGAASITAAPTATIAPAKAEAQPTQTPSLGGKEYTVQQGDSLWKISVAQYGNGYKWVEIAQANSLGNPNIIHTGNVLKLP